MAVTVTAQWVVTNYIKSFSYTGTMQTWTVPYTGKYKVELWGAQGGSGKYTTSDGTVHTAVGHNGGYTSGQISLNKNTSFYIAVGYHPIEPLKADATTFNNGTGNSGGWNGGGSTDIRTVSGVWDNANSIRSRIMVAAGGGTHNTLQFQHAGGAAGGLTGYNGGVSTGGTQTSVGTTQANYTASSFGIANGGCTGGNGWYPAGGATCVYGSGGGSSYISGHTGSVAVASTSSSSPKSGCTTGTTNNACSISPYGYTFTNTVIIDGAGYKWTNTKGALQQMPNPSGGNYASGVGHSGNGYAKITWLGV